MLPEFKAPYYFDDKSKEKFHKRKAAKGAVTAGALGGIGLYGNKINKDIAKHVEEANKKGRGVDPEELAINSGVKTAKKAAFVGAVSASAYGGYHAVRAGMYRHERTKKAKQATQKVIDSKTTKGPEGYSVFSHKGKHTVVDSSGNPLSKGFSSKARAIKEAGTLRKGKTYGVVAPGSETVPYVGKSLVHVSPAVKVLGGGAAAAGGTRVALNTGAALKVGAGATAVLGAFYGGKKLIAHQANKRYNPPAQRKSQGPNPLKHEESPKFKGMMGNTIYLKGSYPLKKQKKIMKSVAKEANRTKKAIKVTGVPDHTIKKGKYGRYSDNFFRKRDVTISPKSKGQRAAKYAALGAAVGSVGAGVSNLGTYVNTGHLSGGALAAQAGSLLAAHALAGYAVGRAPRKKNTVTKSFRHYENKFEAQQKTSRISTVKGHIKSAKKSFYYRTQRIGKGRSQKRRTRIKVKRR